MKTKVIGFLLLAVAAAAVAHILFLSPRSSGHVARITRDGVFVEEIDLSQVDEPYFLVLEDERGKNTLQVERDRIRVSEADCPDQICVRQGFIVDGTVPIVCLPHRLMIEIGQDGEKLDARAG